MEFDGELIWLVVFILLAMVMPIIAVFHKKEETPIKELVRPLVTMQVVTAFIVVVVHGALWCGEEIAFNAITNLTLLCVGFYFAGRAYEKANKDK